MEPLESRSLMAGDLCDLPLPMDDGDLEALIANTSAPPPVANALSQGEGELQGEGEDSPDLVAFAKALAAAGVQFFGAAWCPVCTAQKALFEDGSTFLPFIEVTNPDRTPNSIATQNNITTYPTWVFPGGARLEGLQTLAALSTASGIAIPNGSSPSFAPIANTVSVLGGSPLWVGLDGYDPNGGALTYEVTSSNPSLLQATIERGRTFTINVEGFGPMVFQLFDSQASRATGRIAELSNSGFYNKTQTNEITFHRVINNFVIQGGDPTNTGGGGSSLGDFDDHFHVDLQHNQAGLISYAKTTDDTNDSQFFVLDGAARHLDFNHSIFGMIVEGNANRAAISDTPTNSSDRPLTPVVISSTTINENDTENGLLRLKAAEGATGTAQVTVTVRDAMNNSFSQTFTVNITPDTANGAPFLSEIGTVRGTTGQTINLQLQATDAEGNPSTFEAAKPSSTSVDYTFTVNNTTSPGLVAITPPAGFVGTFPILVGVRGTSATTTTDTFDTQLVNVQVAPPPPTAIDLSAQSDTGFSNTDNVTNASALTFTINGVTSGATVKLKLGNTELASGAATGTSISLTVTNLSGFAQGANQITATQTVNGVESDASSPIGLTYDTTAPAANTSTAPTEATAGTLLTYNAQNAEEGQTGFSYSLVDAPAGMTIVAATGVVTWTPAANQVGAETFGVIATDAAGNSTTQTINLTVSQSVVKIAAYKVRVLDVNSNPVTNLDLNQDFFLQVIVQDLRTGVPTLGVFQGYTDVAFDSTKAMATGAIVFGSAYTAARTGNTSSPGLVDEAGALSGSFSGMTGEEFELFRVPMRATGSGTLTFATNPPETLPALDTLVFGVSAAVPVSNIDFGQTSVSVALNFNAVNDTFNVDEDSQNFSLNPLANDTATGGTSGLTITAISTGSNGGVATITGNGKTISYTPAANFNGAETFTYTIVNGAAVDTDQATITVQVQPVNDNPTAVNDTASVQEDSSNNVIDVLANDSIAPDVGETLRVTAVTQSANGTVSIGPNGATVRFTPTANFVGVATFTYTVSDGNGGTAIGTVSVTVNETNDNPVATNDSFTVAEDTVTDTFLNVLSNDNTGTDVGETLTVTTFGSPSGGGTVTLATNGTGLNYRPAANFQGVETFTYSISDGRGGTATATVSVTVTNSNDPPTATNDTLTAFRNSPATFNVLANDSSAPDPTETLTIVTVTQPAHGTVSITENGARVLYTPTTDYTGPDSFTYTIRDPGGLEATATANITVQQFAPSTLSGFVYMDADNNGVRMGGEMAIVGVTITLSGNDVNNQAVNRTTKTGADGGYSFTQLLPGTYTITQAQPTFLIDGLETVGSQGGTSTVNNQIVSTIAQGTTGINNNFGERGRVRQFVSIRDFFTRSARTGVLAAVDSSAGTLWHVAPANSFNGVTNPVFTIQNSGSQLTVAGKNSAQADVSTTLLVPSSNVRTLGSQGTARLYSLLNTQSLTYSPSAASMVSGGEGEFAGSPSATDSALLALYGDSVSRRTSVIDYSSAVDQVLQGGL